MKILKLLSVLAVSAALAGCSIHPLPENFSRSSTFEIVQKIRCEARDAVAEVALSPEGKARLEDFLSEAPGTSAGEKKARLERARQLLRPELRSAAIGYSFKFSITEGDTRGGSALFEMPLTNGVVSLGVAAGEDKKRKSERSFDLIEDFAQLIADPTLGGDTREQNWQYPITGEIGLREVIRTYVNLAGLQIFSPSGVRASGSGNNGGSSAGNDGGRSGGRSGGQGGQSREIYEFIDELTFTTTYNASVSPGLELKPVAHDFRLTEASAVIGGRREDIHSVTIALKAPTPGRATAQRSVSPVPLTQAPLSGGGDAKDSVYNTLQNNKALKALQERQ